MILLILVSCIVLEGAVTEPYEDLENEEHLGISIDYVNPRILDLMFPDYFYDTKMSLNNDITLRSKPNDIHVKPCPPGMSKITSNDMHAIIKHIIADIQIVENLNNTFYPNILHVVEKHTTELEAFTKRFYNYPEHLKDILNYLAEQQDNLTKVTGQLAVVVNTYPEMIQVYDTKLNKLHDVKDKAEKVTKICELNCNNTTPSTTPVPNRNLLRLTKLYDTEYDYYQCITLSQLKENVIKYYQDSIETTNKSIQTIIDQLDDKYNKAIDKLETSLKEIALQEYSQTMYNVLKLEDEYFHFVQFLKKYKDLNAIDINQKFLQFDYKAIDLERELYKLKKTCLNCGKYKLRKTILPEEEENLDKKVFDIELQNIIDFIKQSYISLFEELDEALDKEMNADDVIEAFKKNEADIENMIGDETSVLESLKNQVPEKQVLSVVKLAGDADKLIENVEKINEDIKKLTQ